MTNINDEIRKKPWIGWSIFFASMIIVFVLGLFAASIMERRTEALVAYTPAKPIPDFEPRIKVWGENFPREYATYLQTKETNFVSKYNGNDFKDALEEDPLLVVLWAGYLFSQDYNRPRGHLYAIEDIRKTLRTGAPKDNNDGPQPSTCWSCKSPDVVRLMKQMGPLEFYKGKWASKGHEVVNDIGCLDCHDPKTMNLTITRPALVEAFQRQGIDITKATHSEKRSLVCAQCHVEYYFKGDDKYLTFPWDKGISVEDIEKYYDNINFVDWTHALSRAPMLKAQHPEYETWKMGIHSRRGVSCADCHMPYISEGGIKFTDHHITTPLKTINRSCQVCHRESEDELKQNVYTQQDRVMELRMKAEETLAKAHIEAKLAWDKGASKDEMQPVLTLIRHAGWRWDFAVASHGASFHASAEMSRVLGTSIDKSGKARVILARILAKHGVNEEVIMPDLSTKAKAQKFIGLDMNTLKNKKDAFLKDIVPKWDDEAKKREEKY